VALEYFRVSPLFYVIRLPDWCDETDVIVKQRVGGNLEDESHHTLGYLRFDLFVRHSSRRCIYSKKLKLPFHLWKRAGCTHRTCSFEPTSAEHLVYYHGLVKETRDHDGDGVRWCLREEHVYWERTSSWKLSCINKRHSELRQWAAQIYYAIITTCVRADFGAGAKHYGQHVQ
jgi:hypothetical protein